MANIMAIVNNKLVAGPKRPSVGCGQYFITMISFICYMIKFDNLTDNEYCNYFCLNFCIELSIHTSALRLLALCGW